MGDFSEFSLPVRLFLKAYPWRRIDPVPWTPLPKPLAQCRLALVSSAGFSLPNQLPFDESVQGGDPSFRAIPADTDVKTLIETHRSESFDHTGLQQDPNLVFPGAVQREDQIGVLLQAGVVEGFAAMRFNQRLHVRVTGDFAETGVAALH